MELDALILFLVLLAGLLTFSYEGYRMLREPATPALPKSLAGSARQTVMKLTNTDATDIRRAMERFDDDGGRQALSRYVALARLEWVASLFRQQDTEPVKQREKRCPVCGKKYPEEDNYCGDDGSVLEDARGSDDQSHPYQLEAPMTV